MTHGEGLIKDKLIIKNMINILYIGKYYSYYLLFSRYADKNVKKI